MKRIRRMLMAILRGKIRKNGMKIPRRRMRKLRNLGNEQRKLRRLNPDGNLRALKLMESRRGLKDGNPRNVKAAL